MGPRSDTRCVAPIGRTCASFRGIPTMKASRLITAGSLLVCAALVLAACAAPKINTRSQTDPSVNLASYKTYAFVSDPGTNRGGYSTPITGYLDRKSVV